MSLTAKLSRLTLAEGLLYRSCADDSMPSQHQERQEHQEHQEHHYRRLPATETGRRSVFGHAGRFTNAADHRSPRSSRLLRPAQHPNDPKNFPYLYLDQSPLAYTAPFPHCSRFSLAASVLSCELPYLRCTHQSSTMRCIVVRRSLVAVGLEDVPSYRGSCTRVGSLATSCGCAK